MISQEDRLIINELNETGLRERENDTETDLSEITFNKIFAHLKETKNLLKKSNKPNTYYVRYNYLYNNMDKIHNLPYVKDNWYNLSKSDKEEIIKKWYFNYQRMFREILNSELFFVFEIENN